MIAIKNYHAHVYFQPQQFEQAQAFCHAAGEQFGVRVGRFHQQPVGPHPMSMCQLSIDLELFAQVIPWLALNRKGLVIFIHPDTGDDLKDHTEHAMWMGDILALKLDIFK